MRIEKIKIYEFSELSETAKDTAIEDYRNSDHEFFWGDDYLKSIEKGLKHFDFELIDYSFDYYCASNGYFKIESNFNYHSDENDVKYLSGVRLWKYLQANYMQAYCNHRKQYESLLDDNYILTGFCSDYSFLQPIKDFIKKPTDITFEELMKECVDAVLQDLESDYNYQQTDECISENIISNEYEFIESGKLF